MSRLTCTFVLLLVALTSPSPADDWPQFRGPNRDGASKETDLLKEWPAGGPKLLWTYSDAGVGYAGPAVVGDRLYMSGGRGDTEYVFALDLKSAADGTVKQVWAEKIGPLFHWTGNQWNAGPNANPTVAGDLVYALGGRGDLVCVAAADGKDRWRKNLPRDLGGEVNPIGGGAKEPTPLGWGYAGAPLVDGDRLVCAPGGKRGLLAALDKATGELVWQSKDVTDQTSYSSPVAAEVGGVRQYVQVVNAGIVGVAAADGKRLWSYRRQPAYDDVVIATPIVHDSHVFATVGFKQGCDLVKLLPSAGGTVAEKVFSTKSIENRDGGVVLVDGHVFGHSEDRGWFCMEFKTGKLVWEEPDKLGRGSVTYADGNLYCCAEKGGVVAIVEASPKGWNERGRLKLPKASGNRKPSGGVWTHPVIANGRLYVRDQELLFCYDLRK
jgi:outer membrane protein assembly factor BamB